MLARGGSRCYNSINERQERKEVFKCPLSQFSSHRCSLSFLSLLLVSSFSLSQANSGGCKGEGAKALLPVQKFLKKALAQFDSMVYNSVNEKQERKETIMKTLNLIVEATPKKTYSYAVVSYREIADLVWFQSETIEECEHWISLQREDEETWFSETGDDAEIASINYTVKPYRY